MNKKIAFLGVLATLMSHLSHPAYADITAAGYPCTNSGPNIKFGVGSDALDDLLACVSGSWHSMIYGTSPAGAVQAFNLAACPSGWVPVPALAGRTIIGAGAGAGLTPRSLGTSGGEETHKQTVPELPQFQVTFTFGASDKGGAGNGFAYSDNAGGATVRAVYNKASNIVGSGTPFNVMMPYTALLYCMKN